MFSHLRVQQVKVQLVFMLVVSQVTPTIHTSVVFGDELVRMAVLKLGNPAFRDLLLRNRAAEIFQNTSCRWYTIPCTPFYISN
ncbi:uncharacterized protein M421DRAFT_399763 [Didymella exigua CBS 183.55]|uniref:Uncharacterized protein n=1 Tax=Didymella exigua CBS 183.55 TaxID=1150837 RepID=A0A6A5RDH3_9PLEO|nr:uncharacterized protein M421DRAFT_399763 [Didymella exigua CBS 183.55]KAF1925278.1 hypothetical protein M421DRAFT_399763 [Didymella exigua CBS 183.55]